MCVSWAASLATWDALQLSFLGLRVLVLLVLGAGLLEDAAAFLPPVELLEDVLVVLEVLVEEDVLEEVVRRLALMDFANLLLATAAVAALAALAGVAAS